MSERRCGNCEFWRDGEVVLEGDAGECVRFPPVKIDAKKRGLFRDKIFCIWSFPTVKRNWICGEFHPRTEQEGEG